MNTRLFAKPKKATVCLLIFCLFASMIMFMVPVHADGTFGYTTKGASPTTTNAYAYKTIYSLPEDGVITAIGAYITTTSTCVVDFGVYNDTTLLVNKTESLPSGLDGWVTIDIPDIYCTSGSYGLAFKIITTGATFYWNSGGSGQYDDLPTSAYLPHSFVVAGQTNRYYTMNATYTTSEPQEPGDLSVTLNSPLAKYYTTSSVTVDISSSGAEDVYWNLYNGTHWLYGVNQTYTTTTAVTLGNGCYKLYAWAINSTAAIEETAIFGVNLDNPNGAIYASGGSNTQIQAAINAATDGYAVYLPAGEYVFDAAAPWSRVTGKAGVSIYGAPCLRNSTGHVIEWQTTLIMPYEAPDWSYFLYFDYGTSNYVTRITGIHFMGYRTINPASTLSERAAIYSYMTGEMRIDHCYFDNCVGTGTVQIFGATGCFDHNKLVNYPFYIKGVWAEDTVHYGFYHVGRGAASQYWLPLANVMGKYNERDWYIEDNYFSGYEVGIQNNDCGHYVARYNIFENCWAGTSMHWNTNGYGGRLAEVYNNTFTYPNPELTNRQGIGAKINCGSLICTGNTFLNYPNDESTVNWKSCVQLCQGNPDTVSWSHVQDSYIYDNTLNPLDSDLIDLVIATWYGATIYPVLNEDYFLRAPTLELDGFIYTPYQYPHPLVTSEGILNAEETQVYYLTVESTVGGEVYPSPGTYGYYEGEQVTIYLVPDGENTPYLSIDGSANVTLTDNAYTLTMNSNHTATATFEPPTPTYYYLEVSVPSTLLCNLNSGVYAYISGTQVNVTITESIKWICPAIEIDGVNSTELSIILTMNQNHTIIAYAEFTGENFAPPSGYNYGLGVDEDGYHLYSLTEEIGFDPTNAARLIEQALSDVTPTLYLYAGTYSDNGEAFTLTLPADTFIKGEGKLLVRLIITSIVIPTTGSATITDVTLAGSA